MRRPPLKHHSMHLISGLPHSGPAPLNQNPHFQANMYVVNKAYRAPITIYRKIIKFCGFDAFMYASDIVDEQPGGYTFENLTVSFAMGWLRNGAGKFSELKKALVPGCQY